MYSAAHKLMFGRWKLVVISLLILVYLYPQVVSAGDLGTKIRIDHLATSKTTGGMICATPETNGTESSIQIIFPTGFLVNSGASNWTVTTSNLPSGATALPGIATATGVSGQTVTFPSNDLSVGTEYCFNFSSSNTLTTPSSTGSYTGILRTMNSSSQAIDYRAFTTPVVQDEGISVSATVAAKPTDYSGTLQLTSPSNNSTFSEGTVLTYQLTYGSTLPYGSDITVEAQWNLGTIVGGSVPTEDILDYVVGSASYGYNGAPPVIDISNRKIDWTIPNFPGNSNNKTVTFKLIVNNSSAVTTPVTFTVDGRVYGIATQTADSTVTSTYQKSSYITPTPTPTCAPGHCPTPTPAPTAVPTPTTPPTPKPIIKDIQIRTVGSNQGSIYIATNNPTSARIDIGTEYGNLRSLGFSKNPSTQHLITLSKLQPNTRYYFRVTVTDHDVSTSSDLYVLTTAIPSEPILISPQTLIVTSGDVILFDASSSNSGIVIPQNTPYSFKFRVKDFDKIKSIQAFTRSNNVLGISTATPQTTNTDSVPVTEVAAGEFVGKLFNQLTGSYKLVLQIQDFNGNIAEQKIADVYVVTPLQVINAHTKNGIEGAKVIFYLYNPRLKIYSLITSSTTPIKNPSFSEPDGYVPTVLPAGIYRAEVEALGYKSKSVEFTLGSSSYYPVIDLTPLPFSILTYFKYSASTASDVLGLLKGAIHTLRISFRFFDLVSVILACISVLLTLFAVARKLAIPVQILPYFAIYCFISIFRQHKHNVLIHGIVANSITHENIRNATVVVMTKKGIVLAYAKTNAQGEFITKLRDLQDIKIRSLHKNFTSTLIQIKKDDIEKMIKMELLPQARPEKISFRGVIWYGTFVIDALFETILIITLLIEFFFVLEFGWLKVAPFLIISLLNICLWAYHVKHSRSIEA